MRAERFDGHRAELRQLCDQLLLARDAEVLEDLPPTTYREITTLLRG
jgi:hypothetical protein